MRQTFKHGGIIMPQDQNCYKIGQFNDNNYKIMEWLGFQSDIIKNKLGCHILYAMVTICSVNELQDAIKFV